MLQRKFDKLLNLEVGTDLWKLLGSREISNQIGYALFQKKEKKTTEGGIDICHEPVFQKVKDVASFDKKKSPATKISLFVEGSEEIFDATIKMNQR